MAKNNREPHGEAGQFSSILTKAEAAKLLGCSRRYLEQQIKAGRIRACKPSPKFLRIYRKDLDAFLLKSSTV